MEEVKEEFVEGEISVDELAEFLVEEVYTKYPPLLNLFNNNKEEMKRILKSNVHIIKRIPEDRREGVAARYNLLAREIEFYSKNKIGIDTLRRSNDMMHIIVHESLHALFTSVRLKKMSITGCSSNGKSNKKTVRGVFEQFCILTGQKNIIRRFFMKQNFYRRINDKNIGDGLNEGFTVWLTERILGTEMSKAVYPLEKYYVETIYDLVGEEKTLQIAKGNYKELARLLNMRDDEFLFFMKGLDVASRESTIIDLIGDHKNPGEETKQSMGLFNVFNGAAQFTFISRFVIPIYENKIKEEGLSTDNLELLCYIVSRFRGIQDTTNFSIEGFTHYGKDSCAYLEELLERKFIEYSNIVDVSNLSNSDIMRINGMYDFIFRTLERQGENDINEKFIKSIKMKMDSLTKHRSVVVHIHSGGVPISAVTETILRVQEIEEQERKASNRAMRRTMKKQEKQARNHR